MLFFLTVAGNYFVSCDDNTGSLGYDIVPNTDLVDNNFTVLNVKTSSYEVGDKVLARSSTSYLGKYTDPETGTVITFAFPDNIVDDYITGAEIRLYVNDFIGDSLATFKLNVYELDKVMDANSDYYTNIDPSEYYDETAKPVATKWFTISDRTISDDTRWSNDYVKSIRIALPREMGQQIYDAYRTQPQYFSNTDTWLNSGLPGSKGFYFQVESGDGAIAYVNVAHFNINFRFTDEETKRDTLGTMQFACTEEVVQATRFRNSNLTSLLDNKEATYLKSPAGIFTMAELPVDEISLNDTINSARLVLKRYNDIIDGKFKLPITKTVLLVRLDDYLNGFFEKYSLADGITSYVTNFSSSTNTYEFSNIAKLINVIQKEKAEGKATENYNKVLLIPVEATYSTINNATTLVKLAHDFSMSSVKLVGGDNDNVGLEIVYSNYRK